MVLQEMLVCHDISEDRAGAFKSTSLCFTFFCFGLLCPWRAFIFNFLLGQSCSFMPSLNDVSGYLYCCAELPDKYVYDYYAVQDDMDITEENAASPFPLVQVEDDDYYDGPDDSEYESDDSNAENNPLNDYPDEESSDIEDDVGSKCSEDDSEIDSRSSCHQSEEAESINQRSIESGISGQHNDWSEDEVYDDYDDFSDQEEWR